MLRRIIFCLISVLLLLGCVGCGKEDVSENASPSPTEPVFNVDSQEGVNELYQLTDSGQMMSYIIKTKNGKLIVLDGGYERNGKELVALAKELTGQEVPEIEAWFFSHSHSDHVNAFTELMTNAGSSLSVKGIYHHLTSEEYVLKREPGNIQTYRMFMKAVKLYDPEGNKTTVVQQGDVFTFDDVTVEVLLVPDEEAEVGNNVVINEASVIYRMTIDGQRVLFLGDAYHQAGNRLIEACGDDITADIVQMAHHGSQGVQESLYALIQPKACLWPTPQWLWDNDDGDGYNTGPWETIELNRYMRNELGVKHHYIAKDGLQQLVFPLDLE